MDDPPERAEIPKLPSRPIAAPPTADDLPLAVVMADTFALPASPILSKLYQESNLRLAANRAALHPSAAADSGVKDGGRALLQTRSGKLEVTVTLDPAVPRGVVQLAAAASTLELFASSTRAKVARI
jgi:hypothetical protein